MIEAAKVRPLLQHVYWIGGGSGAGKSTIARRLAAEFGLRLYVTDEAMTDHTRRLSPEEAPRLARFRSMNMDQRWALRSPVTMLETFHWFRGEGFRLIVDDLLALPRDTGVVAEGFRLLPHLVAPLLTEPNQAVWLLPTPEFRQAAFDSRGTTWNIANNTTHPERAQRNLLERDHLFTEHLRSETERLRLQTLDVTNQVSEDTLTDQVKRELHR